MTHEKSARLQQTRLPFRGKRRVVLPLVPRGCCDALQGACKTTGSLADLATIKTTPKAHTTDEIAFQLVSVTIQYVPRTPVSDGGQKRTCFACRSVASEDLKIPDDCVVSVLPLQKYSRDKSSERSAISSEFRGLRGVECLGGENETELCSLFAARQPCDRRNGLSPFDGMARSRCLTLAASTMRVCRLGVPVATTATSSEQHRGAVGRGKAAGTAELPLIAFQRASSKSTLRGVADHVHTVTPASVTVARTHRNAADTPGVRHLRE
ncbi:hypothetical protein MTO96_034669 [Rhipicephalus appendiculatus]